MDRFLNTPGRVRICLWLCLILLLAVASVCAGEYRGQVTFNGSGVPGAVVKASSGDQQYAAITDGRGDFVFAELPDGLWNIQVEMQAFSPILQEVAIGPETGAGQWELHLLSLDQIQGLQAAPASTAPASPVSGAVADTTAQAEKEPSRKGTAPSPANTQTPFQRTEVNVAPDLPSAQTDSVSFSNSAFGDLSMEDLKLRAADGFLISGTTNNSAGSQFAQNRSFGNNRGILRSLYNGNIGFTINNSALNARAYSLAGVDTPKPAYNLMQGMFSFGGPLRIPRLIRNGPTFYVGYQFVRNRNAQTQSALVPTAAERIGDLSQAPGQIFDPESGLPFLNNQIPDDRISEQARCLMALYPLPNFTGNTRYNYQIPLVGRTHQDALFANMSRTIGRKNQISGTFSLQSARGESPSLLGFLDTNSSLGSSLSVNWQRSFTPRLTTTFGYQFTRQSGRVVPFFENRQNISGLAGIQGNNQEPVNWGPPAINFFSGLASLSDALPSSRNTQSSALVVSGYWNHGDHTFSFGGEYRRQQLNLRAQQDPRGAFTFTGASTLGAASGILPSGARNDFAGFLLGIPDTASIAFGNADKYFRSNAYTAYFADDWRVNRSLTLNIGLRWEYGAPVTERQGRLVNLDIVPGFSAVSPVLASSPVGALTGIAYPNSLLRADRQTFQPRIGFSWKPLAASSMVVRGGYGIYYNASPYQSIALEMAQQSPLSKSLSQQNSVENPLTLENGFTAPPNATTNTFAVNPDLRIGYVHIWQLSVQIDLPVALQLSASYQGTRGRHALQEFLPNTYPAGAVNPCPACPSGFRYMTSNGISTRDSGTIQLRRRLHNGLTATMQYTFSKAMDDAAPGTAGTSGGVFIAQNWLNPRGEWARSSFDQRHVASFQFQYTTGMGVRSGMLLKGWKGALFKEWTVSSQINAGSGNPLTPVYPSAILGTGVTGPVRPDTTGQDIYAPPPGLHLNPAAYQAPAAGYWGNAGRNSITGPSQFNLNAALGRTFRTSDRTSLNLNITANNALNHVSFTSWNTTVGSAQFGLPMAANSMRSLQTTIRWRF